MCATPLFSLIGYIHAGGAIVDMGGDNVIHKVTKAYGRLGLAGVFSYDIQFSNGAHMSPYVPQFRPWSACSGAIVIHVVTKVGG